MRRKTENNPSDNLGQLSTCWGAPEGAGGTGAVCTAHAQVTHQATRPGSLENTHRAGEGPETPPRRILVTAQKTHDKP